LKVVVPFPNSFVLGSIPQNEKPEAVELAQKALFQAGATTGTITKGWHDEHSQDPLEHFDIEKHDAPKKGIFHVHRDGSWTQGKGGKAAHGDGRV
jgi:hypothetical protein